MSIGIESEVHDQAGVRAGQMISLLPLSKRAKQIVKEHGSLWEVLKRQSRVLFSDTPGPWLFVQPLAGTSAPSADGRSAHLDSASRWIHGVSDDKFKVKL